MYVKINCKLQTLGHIFEIRTWGETKNSEIPKKTWVFGSHFFWLSGSESHETKKGSSKGNGRKRNKNTGDVKKEPWTL